jgi:hypothetical protein
MGGESVCSELKKLPWITENGLEKIAENDAPKHSLKCGSEGQSVSDHSPGAEEHLSPDLHKVTPKLG